jgi:hypothetical protein
MRSGDVLVPLAMATPVTQWLKLGTKLGCHPLAETCIGQWVVTQIASNTAFRVGLGRMALAAISESG